jgi:hypothetical protein
LPQFHRILLNFENTDSIVPLLSLANTLLDIFCHFFNPRSYKTCLSRRPHKILRQVWDADPPDVHLSLALQANLARTLELFDQFKTNRSGEQKRKAAAKAKSNAKKLEQEKQKKSDAMGIEDKDINDEEMDGREYERMRDQERIEVEQEEIHAEEAEEDANDAENGAQEDAESVVGD